MTKPGIYSQPATTRHASSAAHYLLSAIHHAEQAAHAARNAYGNAAVTTRDLDRAALQLRQARDALYAHSIPH